VLCTYRAGTASPGSRRLCRPASCMRLAMFAHHATWQMPVRRYSSYPQLAATRPFRRSMHLRRDTRAARRRRSPLFHAAAWLPQTHPSTCSTAGIKAGTRPSGRACSGWQRPHNARRRAAATAAAPHAKSGPLPCQVPPGTSPAQLGPRSQAPVWKRAVRLVGTAFMRSRAFCRSLAPAWEREKWSHRLFMPRPSASPLPCFLKASLSAPWLGVATAGWGPHKPTGLLWGNTPCSPCQRAHGILGTAQSRTWSLFRRRFAWPPRAWADRD